MADLEGEAIPLKTMLIRFLTAWLFRLTSTESIMMMAKEKLVLEGNKVEIKIKKVMSLRRVA